MIELTEDDVRAAIGRLEATHPELPEWYAVAQTDCHVKCWRWSAVQDGRLSAAEGSALAEYETWQWFADRSRPVKRATPP